ncbi:MAG: DsbA family protein [Candidatus Liptonbacteria bacterium]
MEQQPTQPDRFLPISILVAGILISGSLIYTTRDGSLPVKNNAAAKATSTENGTPTVNVSDLLPRDVVLGDANAPVTLIEYGDYQCPWCARFFSQTESQVRKDYVEGGKVKIIFRDFAFLGQESIDAANAAQCAKDQSKFWPFHDAVYTAEEKDANENNGNMDKAFFINIATDLGMDVSKFTQCYNNKTYVKDVTDEYENGTAAGVSGTPSAFINGKAVPSGSTYSAFKAIIEDYLKK